jgi:hypothetical protein
VPCNNKKRMEYRRELPSGIILASSGELCFCHTEFLLKKGMQ